MLKKNFFNGRLLFTFGTVHSYCSFDTVAVLFKEKILNLFFLVPLTWKIHDYMQELYFIKCLLVIHARNGHGLSLTFMVCNNN